MNEAFSLVGNFIGGMALIAVGILAIKAVATVVHGIQSFINRPRTTGVNMARYEQVVEELVGSVDWTRDNGGAGPVIVNPVCQRNVYHYIMLRRRGDTREEAIDKVWSTPIMQPADDPIPVFAQQQEAEQRFVITHHIQDDRVAEKVQEAAVNRVMGEQPNPHGMQYIDGYLYNTAPKPSIVARDTPRSAAQPAQWTPSEIPMAQRDMGPSADPIDVTGTWPQAKKSTRKGG